MQVHLLVYCQITNILCHEKILIVQTYTNKYIYIYSMIPVYGNVLIRLLSDIKELTLANLIKHVTLQQNVHMPLVILVFFLYKNTNSPHMRCIAGSSRKELLFQSRH